MKQSVHFFFIAVLIFLSVNFYSQQLKSLVYDFDGLDINQNDLPEGDYRVNDLTYMIAANPIATNDMLGDRVLRLNLNWNTSYGAFGRGISRYIEFNPASDMINFYFYNPYSNNQSATIDVVLGDDDNQNLYYDYGGDDTWKKSLVIAGSAGWQLISIPLNQFVDINPGGNGVFDIAFSQNKGMLLFTEFRFFRNNAPGNATFYLDFISFSEGNLPRGATIFDLPPKNPSGYALLGAYKLETKGQENLIPPNFEALFPPGKKIKYANWFMQWATNGGTTPHELPGNQVQILLNNGYRPIITWEPLFGGYSRLDPVQPRLQNIINGNYDWYIDQFANKIKTYNDTVIIRFMHEFEGDWYPWSLVHNSQDPNRYITAFRKVVDRFRALGATKVKWMWCVNSDYAPYRSYNWIVPAYPGDNYVDIVATDIYNNHWPVNLPWWRSFRWQTTESYYYLTKYFPNKPLLICEVGCRERFGFENQSSESKGAWYARMDKEMQSNFQKVRGLIFFHANPDHNWLVNSSPSALQSLTENVWNDSYYFAAGNNPPPPQGSTCSATGSILREVWNNISGTSVANIPLGTPPGFSENISSFQTVSNSGDNYGQRIRGYICPPITGNYIFWISSDDNSELWLSSNDQQANEVKIASVPGWTYPGEWIKYGTQQSVSKYLVAGQKYFIEAFHKEGSQGDHLAVGWQLPNGSQEKPIPGIRLSPFTNSISVYITSPFNNSTYNAGSSITIYANASGGTGSVTKVEFFAGATKLGEDFSSPYSFNWNNVQAGNYALTAKVTNNLNSTAVSSAINISVSPLSGGVCNASGSILREVWYNVSGTSVANIPVSSPPGSSGQIYSFQAPLNAADNYGQRIRGTVCAPVTGNYIFWISSDDNSELWLSTNDQAANKIKIASVLGWNYSLEWTKYPSQQSAPVYLTAGQKYYIEALHKEGSQGDNLAVGWQIPGGALERPIPGNRLSPATGSPAVCAAYIQPGSSTTFCSGGNVTLYSSTGAGYSYQWIKDGGNISGATASTYNTSVGGNYQVRISYSGCTAWSAPTNVTVNTSLTSRITAGGPTTFCTGQSVTLYGNTCSGYVYQWKKDGADIAGATSANYVASTSGSYQLKIIQGNSINWSALVYVTVNNCGQAVKTLDEPVKSNDIPEPEIFKLNVFPNPTTGLFTFDFCMEEVKEELMEIKIMSVATGEIVYKKPPVTSTGCVRGNIELPGDLQTGIYFLQIRIGEKLETTKIILCR